jgi:nanoRNase/pAp phosphatase (c-di-AMP/oligoRNAs hydrolase)
METQAKQQIAERLKTATNILVTVNVNPSVDQLAATIGLTLLLNKLGKHGTAVFSGQIPSTLEFLKPEDTLEKNTDSLRDFIIALDKSKADKLRYKVEDKIVKIFITPYRTSLTEKDLDFSQGDFNVDVVVALGVKEQKDLDAAITAHGRILHDATVVSINTHDQGKLGTINWNEPQSSSLSEMVVSLGDTLGPNLFDAQMATALLTGIVAETQRFSNDKTSPHTMTVAAHLMSVGANQQLIATKLEKPAPKPAPSPPKAATPPPKPATPLPPAPKVAKKQPVGDFDLGKLDEIVKETPVTPAPAVDGSLKIDHGTPPPPAPPAGAAIEDQIRIDTEGTLHRLDLEAKATDESAEQKTDTKPADDKPVEASRLVLQPPSLGSKLTANTEPEQAHYDPSTDPLSLPSVTPPLLNRNDTTPPVPSAPDKPAAEASHSEESAVPTPDVARSAVVEALKGAPSPALEPIEALNAQPVDLGKTEPKVTPPAPVAPITAAPAPQPAPLPPPQTALSPSPLLTPTPPAPAPTPAPAADLPPLPSHLMPPPAPMTPPTNTPSVATPPPPVPPPMMPPAFGQPRIDDDNVSTPPLAPL